MTRGPRALLSRQQVLTAVALMNSGQTIKATAEEIGVCRSTLTRALQRENVHCTLKPGWKKYTPERARELERLLDAGMTICEAAEKVGITPNMAHEWRRKGVLDTRGHMRRGKRLGDEKYKSMYRRYLDDTSLTPHDLSRIYGVHYATILKNWQKLGLKPDPERGKAAQRAGTRRMNERRKADDARLRQAYADYTRPGSYENAISISRRLHYSWEHVKREWERLNLDVNGATRAKYDREFGHGAYEASQSRKSGGFARAKKSGQRGKEEA